MGKTTGGAVLMHFAVSIISVFYFVLIQFIIEIALTGWLGSPKELTCFGGCVFSFFLLYMAFLGFFYYLVKRLKALFIRTELTLHPAYGAIINYLLPIGLYLAISPKEYTVNSIVIVLAIILNYAFDKISGRYLDTKPKSNPKG